jgi:hypothetical protein
MAQEAPSQAPSGPGQVVLDIGDDIGAAVVTTSAVLAGREMEIRRLDEPWQGHHVTVLERRVVNGTVWAAVFGSLTQGEWQVRVRNWAASPVVGFTVQGGRVTTTPLT